MFPAPRLWRQKNEQNTDPAVQAFTINTVFW